MTYTVVGRCEKTGMLGIAQCSVPIALGARCPFLKSNVGAVSTQAFTNPGLGPFALNLLEVGYSPAKVIAEIGESDSLFDYRQLAIVDRYGHSAVHTGRECMEHRDQIAAPNMAVVVNHMAGPDVAIRMAEAFQANADQILEERLMRSLEAGRAAGGDRDGQNSAALVVYNRDPYARTDLRVDLHQPYPGGPQDAVEELRRLADHYIPLISYYEERPFHADTVPVYPQALTDRNFVPKA